MSTWSDAISAVYDLLYPMDSNNSNYSSTQIVAALNAAHRELCVDECLGLASEKLALTSGVWEYSNPTPGGTSLPLGAQYYVRAHSMRWEESGVIIAHPNLIKRSYDELIDWRYNSVSNVDSYGSRFFANHPTEAKVFIYPAPISSYLLAASPLTVTWLCVPTTITDQATTVLLPIQYHRVWHLRAAMILLRNNMDVRWQIYEEMASKSLQAIRSRDLQSQTAPTYFRSSRRSVVNPSFQKG